MAKRKVYYDAARNLFVEDKSNKPMQKIIKEFGQADWQVIECEDEEAASENGGHIIKYNHKQQQDQARQELETERQRLIAIKPDIIHELHLTDQQFEDLKAICKWGI